MTREATSSPRRTSTIGLALAGLCILLCAAACGTAVPRPRPNIVIVCLDTVRFDTFFLPETGRSADRLTPWLQRAVVMRRAMTTASWTVPAIASFLTGLYPPAHGAGRFPTPSARLDRDQPSALASNVRTMGEMLKDHQYQTAAFVSHPWFEANYGLNRGFDALSLNSDDSQLVSLATSWIDDRNKKADREPDAPRHPFLLYLHWMGAHGAYEDLPGRPQAQALDPSLRARLIATAASNTCSDESSEFCRRYVEYAVRVLRLRTLLAGLLQQLGERTLLGNTIVVAFADHGEEFGEHAAEERQRAADPRSSYGRGHGHSLYQELLHVPLVIWNPDLRAARSDRLTSLVDVVPSLLEWIGAPNDRAGFDGVSMSDPGQSAGRSSSRVLFASGIAYGPGQIAALRGNDKLLRFLSSGETVAFDLEKDPGERRPTDPRGISGVVPLLSSYQTLEQAARPPSQTFEIPAEVHERLRALGYLQDSGPSN
jgi:arylsulfatase A-like enzyme